MTGVNPDEVIVSSGVSGVLDQLAWAICNEGDGVLIGRPVYSGFVIGAEEIKSPRYGANAN